MLQTFAYYLQAFTVKFCGLKNKSIHITLQTKQQTDKQGWWLSFRINSESVCNPLQLLWTLLRRTNLIWETINQTVIGKLPASWSCSASNLFEPARTGTPSSVYLPRGRIESNKTHFHVYTDSIIVPTPFRYQTKSNTMTKNQSVLRFCFWWFFSKQK